MCISSITYAELMHGVEKSTRRDHNQAQVDQFCKHLAILDFDRAAAEEYGRIKAVLESRGQPIGANDFLIAAHAMSQDLILISHNSREFEPVGGLKLENWITDLSDSASK